MTSPEEVFSGGGATGRLMARLDWAGTPLGPVAGWSQSLRAAVRMVLSSRYPMLLLWGSEFSQLYNDAYSALIGDKHPAALGGDVRVTLAEGWDVLEPLIAEAMAIGVASWVPALQLLLDRSGYREEAYFSVSHAPARDDEGRTVGVLTVCSEVTQQIVGERRLRLLRDLSLQGGGQTIDVEATCARLAQAIGAHPLDVPFAAIYLRDGAELRRSACVGMDSEGRPVSAAFPAVVPVGQAPPEAPARSLDAGSLEAGSLEAGSVDAGPWPLRAAAAGAETELNAVASMLSVPAGPWREPVRTALVLPLPSADLAQPVGVLVAGVSPSRGLDEAYRSFFQLLGQQVSVAIRNAQAYEEERGRAEALAELDRVKTGFFTNVSHEFRTPLTLMLGPLADALADTRDHLTGVQRERVDTAWRNATRLLTLVNNLLTFSSLEAGRAANVAHEVDLAELTAELTSVFRAAVERAGLRLVVECEPLPRRVAVDPGNWEKIVTNLLSNALKFTFVGEIRVALRSDAHGVRLTVADTGIGIAEQQLPHLFERFHRVPGARSRSHEGTGIGLALVRELTLLQGGDVRVNSRLGTGTTFTVALPWSAVDRAGAAPIDVDPGGLGNTARAAAQEAIGWLAEPTTPVDPVATPPPAAPAAPSPVAGPVAAAAPAAAPAGALSGDPAGAAVRDARILVADDNSDMRAYLTRLLTGAGWQVETVGDGREALEVIRRNPPDLLLTDVMMPFLDGFQLLRELRRDEVTRALPVVVLSARAGQEASVEGLDLGADDYVVKPFSAAELLARIRRTLLLARIRGTHTRQLSALADTAAVITSGRALEDAVRAVTEQARVLLGGTHAVTELDGADRRPALRFATAAPPGDDPVSGAEPAEAAIQGRRGRRIGSITVWTRPDERLPDDQRALLLPMAQMLAALVENTWELEREQHVARTLQRSLLPERLPTVDGWELSAGYLPATSEAEVGGDWYDVFVLPDGQTVISIGDVAGHGLAAAVTMGQLRNAVRAYAVEDRSPAKVLSRLATLLVRLPTPSVATVFLGYLDPNGGELTWCSAGHPTPVCCRPDGAAEWLGGSVGPPLGSATATPVENRTVLAPGISLVLYTDGLAEAGDENLDAPQRLLGLAGEVAASGVSLPAFVDAVLVGAPQPRRDDIAVLALHRRAPAKTPAGGDADVADLDLGWTYPSAPTTASMMRRDVRAALGDAGVDRDLVDELLIAASEAVNNAVEHAQSPTRAEVDVQVRVSGGVVAIEVQDFGSWRGRRPAMDRGRGATLMNAYGDVRVISTDTGTRVIIERRLRAT